MPKRSNLFYKPLSRQRGRGAVNPAYLLLLRSRAVSGVMPQMATGYGYRMDSCRALAICAGRRFYSVDRLPNVRVPQPWFDSA